MISDVDDMRARGRRPDPLASVADNLYSNTSVAASGLRWPLFLGAIALVFIVYASTWGQVFGRWTSDPTYSHGYLVAAVSAWLVWRCWRHGWLEGTRPSLIALLPMACVGIAWLLGRAASVEVIEQLALPALMVLAGGALFGWKGFRALLLPIGILYLVLPAWDVIRLPLQDLTTLAVGGFLHAVGISALISGHHVQIAAGTFEIAEGCSGLHFFMAATSLAAIQGYLSFSSFRARAALMLVSILVAIVANWIRVGAVIVAGHLSDMQHFLIGDHYYFGWVVFILMMVPVLYFGSRRRDDLPPPMPARMSSALPEPYRLPVLATFLVLVVPGTAWYATAAFATIAPPPELPTAVAGWRMTGAAAGDWQPQLPGADSVLNGRYVDGRSHVDVWIYYFPRQTAEREMVGYGNRFARAGDGQVSASDEPGQMRLDTGAKASRLIRYRYVVNGQVTLSESTAKLLQLTGNLRGRPSAFAVIYSTSCADATCASAHLILDEFDAGLDDLNLAGGSGTVR